MHALMMHPAVNMHGHEGLGSGSAGKQTLASGRAVRVWCEAAKRGLAGLQLAELCSLYTSDQVPASWEQLLMVALTHC